MTNEQLYKMQRNQLAVALRSVLEDGYWSGGEWVTDDHVSDEIEKALESLDCTPEEEPEAEAISLREVLEELFNEFPYPASEHEMDAYNKASQKLKRKPRK